MNVGESVVAAWVLIISMMQPFHYAYRLEIIVVEMKLSAFLMMKNKSCASGFKTHELKRALGNEVFIFCRPCRKWKTNAQLAKSLFMDSRLCLLKTQLGLRRRDAAITTNEAIGLSYENLIKLSLRHRPDL